jgi:hypothetical protein
MEATSNAQECSSSRVTLNAVERRLLAREVKLAKLEGSASVRRELWTTHPLGGLPAYTVRFRRFTVRIRCPQDL